MARFNSAVRTGVRSPVATVSQSVPDTRTALGGAGFTRTAKSELFLLAVSSMSDPKGSFHENGTARDARFNQLLRTPEIYSDYPWARGFIRYLREDAAIRSASIVAAAEIVRARLAAGLTGNRDLISSALKRADEPGELLAYWTSQYGKAIPKPIKRGISDAVQNLYTERNYIKFDSDSKAFQFADVLQLTHPEPKGPWQELLFKHILNVRYRTSDQVYIPSELGVLRANRALLDLPVDQRRSATAGQLDEACMPWEQMAGWLQGPMDARAWETVIPSMGAFALVRNLRNFDQAGISRSAQRVVEDKLADPEQISRSKMLPMRFLNAYRATKNSGTVTAWGPALEQALNLSLQNVPALPGKTLVLVDLSRSMYDRTLTDRSDLRWADAAAVFGAALAKRCERADLFGFGSITRRFNFTLASSVLPLAESISETKVTGAEIGYMAYADREFTGLGGTESVAALRETFAGHDRIVMITDEQYQGGYSLRQRTNETVDAVLDSFGVPSYTWNLAGYKAGQAQSGQRKRHTFGGLSDTAFKVIPALEAGQSQGWPWEQESGLK